ncbi:MULTISPECIES: type II toxin-antitoxin system RelE/ParE family toxin [Photorhabdus]|uniref:Type II toxin-antitoxin system RelE/ParE family toxin n=1 Tax=Photorhabdus bodei TaxID=2029681 RepID=A0AAW6BMF8_9GAMM|nr:MULTISPECIES: type II toxin-antitoxin system RelE/ParE family toxin [Photorhabdus]MCC8465619.1 type II toxin-antitoxin system RelE/ParE family toxin [Photorhabdus bodei]MCT8353635.1 type II toxin-antitoxin system RelE/ParE family toxin [Photorhabdus kayaii]MDB6372954.1 type II toxin-antitoxin system RelE/ParE family toxin [Photorhabdus bodei]
MEYLVFIETPVFSRERAELLTDDEFRLLQEHLLKNHDQGNTISATGGCKKIRWQRERIGKRGGVRIIYYAITKTGRLYLLLIYPKNKKDDLTPKEKEVLKAISNKLQ